MRKVLSLLLGIAFGVAFTLAGYFSTKFFYKIEITDNGIILTLIISSLYGIWQIYHILESKKKKEKKHETDNADC